MNEFETIITIVNANQTSSMINDFLIKKTTNNSYVVVSPTTKQKIEQFNTKTAAFSWTIAGIQRDQSLQSRIKMIDTKIGKFQEDQITHQSNRQRATQQNNDFKLQHFSARYDYAVYRLKILQTTLSLMAKDQNLEY